MWDNINEEINEIGRCVDKAEKKLFEKFNAEEEQRQEEYDNLSREIVELKCLQDQKCENMTQNLFDTCLDLENKLGSLENSMHKDSNELRKNICDLNDCFAKEKINILNKYDQTKEEIDKVNDNLINGIQIAKNECLDTIKECTNSNKNKFSIFEQQINEIDNTLNKKIDDSIGKISEKMEKKVDADDIKNKERNRNHPY